jgi:DNA ligase-1
VRRFSLLYDAIDRTTSTNAKVAAMAEYFRSAPPADAAWAVFFLTGRRLKRLVPYAAINDWTLAATGLEGWMLEECYAVVGDGAETAALVLDQVPSIPADELPLHRWVEDRVMRLRELDPLAQHDRVTTWWRELDRLQRFLFLKLVTGELRVGVSQTLVVRALAHAADLAATTVAARLMGEWTPSPEWYASLLSHERTDDDLSRPYPFFLAAPVEAPIETLGDPADWLIEWKWDGIRAQLVKRADRVHLWSRGEELITTRFPEIAAAAMRLPDGTVLDGEVLAFRDDRPLPFSALQQRIGRQKQVARLARTVPVVFMAYDILEDGGEDIRARTQDERRSRLDERLGVEQPAPVSAATGGAHQDGAAPPTEGSAEDDGDAFTLTPPSPSTADRPADVVDVRHTVLRTSPIVPTMTWEELSGLRRESRERGVEGLMLKRRTATYGVGRKRGDWWKWKIDPFTIDAVLIYAQPGSGRRASLLTDYTFGVWDAGELVPIAKAYSGLSNDEIDEMDRWIRRHTRERFGPVRHVEPVHVFELGFEAIAESTRHRSGIAVRFPRMLRWRTDKKAEDADSLESVRRLLRTAQDRTG